MAIGTGLRQLARDLRTQKLRTCLTTFGIVWGTVAVSLLLAFGQGFHAQIRANQAGLGENIVIAWPMRTSIPFEGLGKGRAIRLTDEDMRLVAAKTAGIEAVSGEHMTSFKLTYGTTTLAADTSGVDTVFGDMRSLIPQAGGRWLNEPDVRELGCEVIDVCMDSNVVDTATALKEVGHGQTTDFKAAMCLDSFEVGALAADERAFDANLAQASSVEHHHRHFEPRFGDRFAALGEALEAR